MEASENNIWTSIQSLGSQSIDAYKSIIGARIGAEAQIAQINANAFTAANARSAASPSGALSTYNQNTPPGMFGAFPQNDGKPTPGGTPSTFSTLWNSATVGLGGSLLVALMIALIVGITFGFTRGR